MLRYLRIAASLVSLAACVLLIALWVRSYRRVDNLYVNLFNTRILGFNSGLGQLAIEVRSRNWPFPQNWHFISQPAAPIRANIEKRGVAMPTLKFRRIDVTSILFMRHWIPVLASGLLSMVLGIRRPWRFSLRTLLIAMALVAVVLGLVIAFSGRAP